MIDIPKTIRPSVIAFFVSAMLVSTAIAQDTPQPRLTMIELTAGMYMIHAEIAQTHHEQSAGLMFRQTMAANEGMLFVYPTPQVRCFWMRNTLIPLTIAFIEDDGTIVNLKNMQPLDERSHCSIKPVRYALEMNQGWFDQRGIKLGFKLRGLPTVSVNFPQ